MKIAGTEYRGVYAMFIDCVFYLIAVYITNTLDITLWIWRSHYYLFLDLARG